MSLDLVREVVKVNRVIKDKTTQIIVENDIIVPDTKPDVAQILSADVDVFTTDIEVDAKDENTLVKGIIRYKILYKPEDSEISIKSINTSIPFSHKMDTPGTTEGVRNIIKWVPEHVECIISNSRKINVKAILQLNRTAIIEEEHILVSDITNNDSAQVLKESMDLTRYVGSNESVYTVNETLEVPEEYPPIREILRNDVKVVNKDFIVSDDKVTISGELNVTTIYLGDDNELSVRYMEHSIPFSHVVEIQGVTENSSCEVDYEVRECNFEAEEDLDGEYKILKGDIEVCAYVWANEKADIDYLVDAYGMRSQFNIEKENIVFNERVFANSSQIITKEVVNIGSDNPEINEILNIYSIPVLTDYRVMEDKIELEGFVTCNINYFYENEGQKLSCYRATVPVSHTVEIKGVKPNMQCKPEMSLEYIDHSLISSKDVEIKLILNVDCKIYNTVERSIIEKITEEQLDESARSDKRPSIVIYFVQPEDTYWKIAKRYRTTIDEIQRTNGLSDEDAVEPGMQILITRKAE